MNLLIDECVDRPIAERLIADGHNVLYIPDTLRNKQKMLEKIAEFEAEEYGKKNMSAL